MSNNLSKLIVLNPSTYDKFKIKYSDSNFLHRKLIPIYSSHTLKDINKWYYIKQELAKYLIGSQISSSHQTKSSKLSNLRDNETQTRKIYKKHIETQTMQPESSSVGTQSNINLPEEIYTNENYDEIDMDTTLQKLNPTSASSAAKRLKHFSNNGTPKIRILSKDENHKNLKQSTLPYQYSPRLTRNRKKLDYEIENVQWKNI